jgi:hypothetical protein
MDIQDFRQLVENNNDSSNFKLKEYLDKIDAYTIIFPHGENLLHFAAGSGNIEMCNYLIHDKCINPNIYNARGATPLLYACLKNQEETVKLLILNNADPRIRSGFSGLFPCQSTSSEKIKKLLEEYDKIVPIDFDNGHVIKNNCNLYQSYKFRLHKYWLTFVVNELLRVSGLQQIDVLDEIPEVTEVLNGGFYSVLNKYNTIRTDYINSMKNLDIDNKCCLTCANTDTQKLLRCSKCKNVYFCDKICQASGNMFHNFDCKKC